MYIEGEVPYVANNNCGYGNYNNSGFGNGWEGLIGLAIIAALFGGWGGFGFGGNRGGNNCATQADLAAGFANSEIMSDLNSIINAQTQGFAGLNTVISNATSTLGYNMLQGFHGVDNAICTLGYQNQMGFNQLGTQLASCCCDIRQQLSDCCCQTQRAIDGINYNMATNTCNIIRANENNTKAILDFLTNEKIEGLRAENTALKGQISNDRQSRFIIDALGPKSPVSAYVVQPPQQVTFPTNCCGNVAYANYNNGGCSGCGNTF